MSISPKINTIAPIKFEPANNDVTNHHVRHFATETILCSAKLEELRYPTIINEYDSHWVLP